MDETGQVRGAHLKPPQSSLTLGTLGGMRAHVRTRDPELPRQREGRGGLQEEGENLHREEGLPEPMNFANEFDYVREAALQRKAYDLVVRRT